MTVSSGGILFLVNVAGNTFDNNITNGVLGTGTLLINSANTNTLSGSLTDGAAGKLALTISGGVTFLTNAGNTYSGATTISGGDLEIGDELAKPPVRLIWCQQYLVSVEQWCDRSRW